MQDRVPHFVRFRRSTSEVNFVLHPVRDSLWVSYSSSVFIGERNFAFDIYLFDQFNQHASGVYLGLSLRNLESGHTHLNNLHTPLWGSSGPC